MKAGNKHQNKKKTEIQQDFQIMKERNQKIVQQNFLTHLHN